jgi:hypothetical protein
MTNAMSLRDDAMRAFISSASELPASAPTWCSGWSAHDLTAHVTAAAEERADLIDDHLAGKPSRATRSWEVREPPFRAMSDAVLRERLQEHAVRFERNVSALREDDTILCVRQGCAIPAPTPRQWRTSCSVSVVGAARQALAMRAASNSQFATANPFG